MFDRAPQDNELRRVMDACLPGLENNPDFDRDVLRQVRGEGKGKKRLSVGFVLVMIFVLAFATIAVAITLNLFEQYGKKDQRLAEIASETVITPVVSTIENEDGSRSTVTITNAYYDGSSLLFAYTIENPEQMARFAPTDEQLKQMELAQPTFSFDTSNEQERLLEDEFKNAQQQGLAFGVMRSRIILSGDTYAETGAYLGTWNEMNEYSDSTFYSCVRDFDSIAQEVRAHERLSIGASICQRKTYFFYDGNIGYTMETLETLKPISMTVARSQNEIRRFEGETVHHGAKLHCIVEETNVHLSAKITLPDQALPELPEGYFYDMCLQDVHGNFIEASAALKQDEHQFVFTFNGTGEKPDIQIASLLIVGDESGTEAVDIALKEKK